MKITCKHHFTLFPKENQTSSNGFSIALYNPTEQIMGPDGTIVTSFAASGYILPVQKDQTYTLEGEWASDKKSGELRWTFQVSDFEEIMPTNKDGIIRYLKTLQGIGPALANNIWDAFGSNTFDILENSPARLLEVKGITANKMEKIQASFLKQGKGRKLFSTLMSYNVPSHRITAIYEKFEDNALDVAQNHPYLLAKVAGIDFKTADKIAKANGLSANSDERIEAAVIQSILQAEREVGHTNISWGDLSERTKNLLGLQIANEHLSTLVRNLHKQKEVFIYKNTYFYRNCTACSEFGIARGISKLMDAPQPNKDPILPAVEKAIVTNNVRPSEEQRNAIITALSNSVCLVTGGPGTGKTMIQKIIISAYKSMCKKGEILLCAPTGRAARRMSESTSQPACTIHQAISARASDDDDSTLMQSIADDGVPLTADLILVDEFSMVDSALANALINKVKAGAQIIFIGDENQLQSVGAGAVLRELSASGSIPHAQLTRVFRQSKGSSVAINAARIKRGQTQMEYADDFRLIESQSQEYTVSTVLFEFQKAVSQYSLDEVTILSPYRKKTSTGVDNLNLLIRDTLFPKSESAPLMNNGKKSFYVGDKVMFTKNTEFLTNGDIGYITAIEDTEDGKCAIVNFGENRSVPLTQEDIINLDLAYATTVHKSQGSEYKSVIMVVAPEHSLLLRRAIVYTAITRAKAEVVVVGQEALLQEAILKEDTNVRNSNLGEILKSFRAKAA